MTENHDYNTPSKGATDWNIPLNENFESFDTDIELRDLEANRDGYTPKQGAKFLATDTGNAFVGDGTQWNALPKPGVLDAGVVVYRSGSDAVARTMSGVVASGPDHAAVIQKAFDTSQQAVSFQRADYDIGRQLTLSSSQRVIHGNGAWLRADGSIPSVLTLDPGVQQNDVAIRNLFVDGAWSVDKGVDLPGCLGSHFERLVVKQVDGIAVHCRHTDDAPTFQNNTFVNCHFEAGASGDPAVFRATGDLSGDGSANANTLVECKIAVSGEGNACVYLEGQCVDWTIIGGDFHTLDIAGNQVGVYADATADNGNVSDLKILGTHIEVQDGTGIAGDGTPLHRWTVMPGFVHADTVFDRAANAYQYLYGGDIEISGTLTENA